jgi:hypothetical protein
MMDWLGTTGTAAAAAAQTFLLADPQFIHHI